MSRQSFGSTIAIAVAVSSLTIGSAWAAQERTSNGNTTGSAVPRGGGDGGGASSGGAPSSGSSSGSSSSGSSMGSSSMPGGSMMEAPRRADDQSSRGRSAGSNPSTGRAVSRGGDSPRGGGSTSASSGDRASSGDGDSPRRAVPAYSRPRGDRPATGVAVERSGLPPVGGGNPIYVYSSYPWGFWGPGYGYGLGYLFYDPWYGGGYGYGDPYGYGGYGGYGAGGYAVSQSYRDTGSLRLKIDPKEAQVYVDGYYVGVVDNFDGVFQKLALDSGGHRVELKADGFQALQFEVLITPGETVTYKGEMKRGQ
jgi:hypothetical protein